LKGFPFGVWRLADTTLETIGKGAAWVVTKRVGCSSECIAYAMIGGAVLCAVIFGAAGFALSDHSGAAAAMEDAIFGGVLGACIGIVFGASVYIVESVIEGVLKSLDSK